MRAPCESSLDRPRIRAFMRRSRSTAAAGRERPFGERGFHMCNQDHWHEHDKFGFLVDTPAVRALIDDVHRHEGIDDASERIEQLKPAFGKLLAADGWLPDEYARGDAGSRMGDGIGQYALYRAEDGSLCLFALV